MNDAFQFLLSRLAGLPDLITSHDSRSYWGYLLATVGIAFLVYLASRRDGSTGPTEGFVGYLLPKRIYAHPSFQVDLKLLLFVRLAMPASWFVEGWALSETTDLARRGYETLFGGARSVTGEPTIAAKVLLGVLLFTASDFARFINHWLHHRVPVLWELHSVHHSAEHLNPLTTYRFHPIEMMLEGLSVVVIVGLLAGLVSYALGGNPISYYGTIYVWAYLRAANALGTNLRHMHVWWAWHPRLSHLLISPAQHQVHHSTDPKHHDKNFGFFFAWWDWAFGSLYVPRTREQLQFGLTNGVSHRTLRGALFNPLARIAAMPRNARAARREKTAG
jgi:sterol desaturase/sphingolipid hydroxylase (fatty acid hydroxylase superfamily)